MADLSRGAAGVEELESLQANKYLLRAQEQEIKVPGKRQRHAENLARNPSPLPNGEGIRKDVAPGCSASRTAKDTNKILNGPSISEGVGPKTQKRSEEGGRGRGKDVNKPCGRNFSRSGEALT